MGTLLHLEGMYGLMPCFFPGMWVRGFPLINALFKAIFFRHTLFHYTVMLAFFTSTLFTHEMIS